jgi:hypothetical protein
MTEQIERTDLNHILSAHNGNALFTEVLERTGGSEGLLRLLGRYIYFNSTFGGGVANLAGEIAARQDLFRDAEDEVELTADRSVEVAAEIFSAAIDEFGDRGSAPRITHRSLAQATLKAVASYYGATPAVLTRVASPNQSTIDAVAEVRRGYGLNQEVADETIFRGIGFHMCSEVLADGEFRVLDSFLRDRKRDLVEHLENAQVAISGVKNEAYYWIRIHTSVEADHFDAAVSGANCALRYYSGPDSSAGAKAWMLEGFRTFAAVQTTFMQRILD